MASRSLDDLQPIVRPLADAFLASVQAAGIDLLVTCTLRSLDEQATLYAQGRRIYGVYVPGPIVTNAKPGQSAHNYGYALDVVPMLAGKCVWDAHNPLWARVGALGQAAGLEWYGAPGQPFSELPHFQLHDWRDQLPNVGEG